MSLGNRVFLAIPTQPFHEKIEIPLLFRPRSRPHPHRPAAQATLLFYEGFSSEDYTEGLIDGQPLVGDGYVAEGIWNTSSTFEAGGLSFPDLLTTDGFRLSRSAGEVTANFDLTEDGPFGTAGVIGTNGLIAGTNFTGPIYFSVLANRADTQDASFAGFNIYNGGTEGMGIGEVSGSDFSWLQGGSNGPIGTPPTPLSPNTTHFYVFKLDYDPATPLAAKIWLDPDPLLSEDDQNVDISTEVATAKPVDGFDSFRLRGTRIWEFDEIRIGTTWEDVTPRQNSTPLAITAIDYDSAGNSVTISWSSRESETYIITVSDDLLTWDLDLEDGISPDPGDLTTQSFNLTESLGAEFADVKTLFFRVEVE